MSVHVPLSIEHSRRLRRGVKLAAGVMTVLGVLGAGDFLLTDHSQSVRERHKQLAVDWVLHEPYALQALGICPLDLRNEAKHLRGSAATTYQQAAALEDRVGTDCNRLGAYMPADAIEVPLQYPMNVDVTIRAQDVLPSLNGGTAG